MVTIFNIFQDTKVWIPDQENVWIGGVILKDCDGDSLDIELEDGRVSTFFISLRSNLIQNSGKILVAYLHMVYAESFIVYVDNYDP